jgi:hypothetical protein
MLNEAGGLAFATFAQLVAEGKSVLESFGIAVVDTIMSVVESVVKANIVAIYATAIGMLGPIAGPIAATVAIGGIMTALAAAKAELGRKTGEARIGSTGTIDAQPATQTSDNIPRLLSRDEGVITAKANLAQNSNGLANYQIIDIANKTGKSFDEILRERSPMAKAIERGNRNNTFISKTIAYDLARGETGTDRSATLKEMKAIRDELAEIKLLTKSQKAQSVELSVEHRHSFDSDELTSNIVKRTQSQLARL